MLGIVGGWSLFVSMTLISSISKERKTNSLMHLAGECMNCMYQTDINNRVLEAASADLQYMNLVAKLQ
jgi:hypothetical protein